MQILLCHYPTVVTYAAASAGFQSSRTAPGTVPVPVSIALLVCKLGLLYYGSQFSSDTNMDTRVVPERAANGNIAYIFLAEVSWA